MSASAPSIVKTANRTLYQTLFLISFSASLLAFTLPVFARGLGASALEIGGLYSIFTVSTLALRPVVGWALDRFGRRRFYLLGMIGYALAMVAYAYAVGLGGLYLARLLNGLAAAVTWITAHTIVADLAATEGRARAMGHIDEWSTRGDLLGAVVGLALLGFFSPTAAWTTIFLGFGLLAAAAAYLAWRYLPETRPTQPVGRMVVPPWRPSRRFLLLMGVILATGFSYAMVSPIYVIFLQDRFQIEVELVALAFLPGGLLFAILPARLGGLSDRYGRALFMALGMVAAGLLYLLLPHTPSFISVVGVYALSSVGWAMSLPAERALVADLSTPIHRGRAFSIYELMYSLGATVGPLVGGWLYDAHGERLPFYINGAVLLLGALVIFIGMRRVPPITTEVGELTSDLGA